MKWMRNHWTPCSKTDQRSLPCRLEKIIQRLMCRAFACLLHYGMTAHFMSWCFRDFFSFSTRTAARWFQGIIWLSSGCVQHLVPIPSGWCKQSAVMAEEGDPSRWPLPLYPYPHLKKQNKNKVDCLEIFQVLKKHRRPTYYNHIFKNSVIPFVIIMRHLLNMHIYLHDCLCIVWE